MVATVEEYERKKMKVNIIGDMTYVKDEEIENSDDDVNWGYATDITFTINSKIDVMINNSTTSTIESLSISTHQNQRL